jgi:hypothetical protein
MGQLKLVPSDHDLRALERAAAGEGTTIQDVAQRAIHDYLVAHVAPDPEWQRQFEEVIAQIQSRIPPEITPEEIEADITAVREERRRERLARHE